MHSYFYAVPSASPRGPFQTIKRRTRGKFSHVEGPCGPFGFRYAVFRNRRGEVLVPVHDLTPETKAAILAAGGVL